MADQDNIKKQQPLLDTELAPIPDSASSITTPYLNVMANPDTILSSKGGGDFTVYREVFRDDTVKATFQQRQLAVVSADWYVEPGGEDAASKAAADALTEDLSQVNWDEATSQMLFGVFYGYAVAEIMWGLRDGRVVFDKIKVRDRARFRWGIDETLYLRTELGTLEPMPASKFWTLDSGADHGDNPYGLGLGHWLYWPVYFKRSDIKFWLIFLEKFGMPTATGTLPLGQSQDPEARKKLLAALRAISTETAVVIPEGAEVALLEAARTGAASYEDMKTAMDAAIAKIVLSQVMTTEAVGGQYKADIQGGVRDHVVKADADLVCESFNRGPVWWWTQYNFPGAKPPRVYRKTDPEEDLGERATRDKAISELGYEPTEQYIKETYGDGWVKKKEPVIPASAPGFQMPDPNSPEFAELAMISALKAGHRADQTAIVDAAHQFASQYESILGKRVEQLVEYAEASGDYETFRAHLIEMLAEAPGREMVQPVERGSVFSRLMGAFRAQR
jgi:phage gp29-like protein